MRCLENSTHVRIVKLRWSLQAESMLEGRNRGFREQSGEGSGKTPANSAGRTVSNRDGFVCLPREGGADLTTPGGSGETQKIFFGFLNFLVRLVDGWRHGF